jgi:hypothetical protein
LTWIDCARFPLDHRQYRGGQPAMAVARAKPLYEAEAKGAKFAPRQVAAQHRQEGDHVGYPQETHLC